MPKIVTADGGIREDHWVVVPHPAEGESLALPTQPALIPVRLWLAGREHYAGGRTSVSGSTATKNRKCSRTGSTSCR